jgi:dual-specificity kinase
VRESPYPDYRPPQKPPIKAKEVYVEVILDRSSRRDQKVDDDDGHYVVEPNSDLTDRCKYSPYLHIVELLLTVI